MLKLVRVVATGVLILLGVLFLLFAKPTYQYFYLQLHGIRAVGTVIELKKKYIEGDNNEGSRSSYFRLDSVFTPIVAYTTRSGNRITARCSVGMSGDEYYFPVGKRVIVLYSAEKPHTFTLIRPSVTVWCWRLGITAILGILVVFFRRAA